MIDEIYDDDDDYIADTEDMEILSFDDDYDLCSECYAVDEDENY